MNDLSPIGVIGGSGLGVISALTERTETTVETPFGPPSSPLVKGTLNGVPVVFLQRHGRGHVALPSEINVRANISALKMAGVKSVLSFSAVGSLDEAAPPGTFVIVDQFLDRTYRRKNTFFGDGLVVHVPLGDPVCSDLTALLDQSATKTGTPVVPSGTYVVMEGPQFSSRAESDFHRSLGGTVIGMTAMPEPKLCREAELCYAMVAMVTDFDCWREDFEAVTADAVGTAMMSNRDKAERLLVATVEAIAERGDVCSGGCRHALDGAIMTETAFIPQNRRRELNFLLNRPLGSQS